MQENEYRGYSLFNDVEDKSLRIRNRAVVMANMAEIHTKAKKITNKGGALLMGYFQKVADVEKKEVYTEFHQQMQERGYVQQAA